MGTQYKKLLIVQATTLTLKKEPSRKPNGATISILCYSPQQVTNAAGLVPGLSSEFCAP